MPHHPIDDFVDLAHYLAHSIQWSEDDHDDLVQIGLYRLFEAMQAPQWNEVRDRGAFASYVMAGWMKEYYTKADREDRFVQPDPDVFYVHVDPGTDDHARYMKAYVEAVRDTVGSVEAEIAQNLVDPSPAVITLAMQEMQEKAALKAAGRKVRGFDTLVIAHRHIAKVLGLSEPQWEKRLRNVREFTRGYVHGESQEPVTSSLRSGWGEGVRVA